MAFVDMDRALIPEYARHLGCPVEDIFIAQPDDGPMPLEILDALVRCRAFDAIVLDSAPERRAGAFVRTVALPSEVDPGKTSATYRDGVLRMRLPKPSRLKRVGSRS